MRFTVPSVSRFTTRPCTTLLDDSPPPVICARRRQHQARGARQRGATHLADAHVVDAEVVGVLGAHVDARLGHQARDQVLAAILLARNGALQPWDADSARDRLGEEGAPGAHPQPLGHLHLVLDVQHVRAGDDDLLQHRQRLGGGGVRRASARCSALAVGAGAAASQRTLTDAFL